MFVRVTRVLRATGADADVAGHRSFGAVFHDGRADDLREVLMLARLGQTR